VRADARSGLAAGAITQPFRIDTPQPVLDDLRERPRHTRRPDAAPGLPWSQGMERLEPWRREATTVDR
jgi:hypothetical protein